MSASIASAAKTAAPIAQGVGTIMSAYGQYQQGGAAYNAGIAQQQQKTYEAAELTTQANQVMGTASQEAANQQQQTNLVLSSVRARAAGNTGSVGIGATDLTSKIAGRGEYDILSDLASGGAKATGLQNQATLDLYQGTQAYQAGVARRSASNIGALSTVMSGASSLFARYGMNGPNAPTLPPPGQFGTVNDPYAVYSPPVNLGP